MKWQKREVSQKTAPGVIISKSRREKP